MYEYVYARLHTYPVSPTRACACRTPLSLHPHMYTCGVHVCICTYIYTHIYSYTHTSQLQRMGRRQGWIFGVHWLESLACMWVHSMCARMRARVCVRRAGVGVSVPVSERLNWTTKLRLGLDLSSLLVIRSMPATTRPSNYPCAADVYVYMCTCVYTHIYA